MLAGGVLVPRHGVSAGLGVALVALACSASGKRQEGSARLFNEDQWPLSTWERYIVDNRKDRVKWACVNWAGAYMGQHTVLGLDRRHIDDVAARIAELGFNCVRLPFSTQGVVMNPAVADKDLEANPQLQGGSRMLDLFDAAVEALTRQRLMVIINNHNSKSGWCCSFDSEEGLWYTPSFNESQWIQGLVELTERYKDNKFVVAFDVRNEPHDYGGVGLTWGDGNPTTDFAAAAARAGNAILSVNPHVLIVIEALCLAKDLRPLKKHQVELMYENRVVYEVHAYHYFQLYSLYSDMFMSWMSTRRLAQAVALLPLACLVVLFKAYRALIVKRPPGVVFTSVGTWIFVVSFTFVLLHVAVWYSMKTTSCSIAATQEQLPNIMLWSALSLVGALIFMCGYEYHCGMRCVKRWVKTHKCAACDNESDIGDGEELDELSHYHMEDDSSDADETDWQLRCRRYDFESHSLAWKGLRTGVPQPADWDSGLCCGLQCGIFSALVFTAMVILYAFCRIAITYWWFKEHHDKMWGFALIQGHAWTAPVWVGEFGTSGARGVYWLNLMQYMSEMDVDWAYWVLNPEKPLTEEYQVGKGWVRFDPPQWVNETWGILEPDWQSTRYPWKMLDLKRVMPSPAHWSPQEYPCNRNIYGSECGG